MSDQDTTPAASTDTTLDDQRIPYERFQQANRKAKEHAERAEALEQQLNDLRSQIEEREQQGMPELDQLRRRLDAAERRAQEAEQAAQQFQSEASNARKERWVARAAQDANFIYPDDAALHVNLGEIETEEDAARAVKRLAKQRPKLVEQEKPGPDLRRVLQDGQPVTGGDDQQQELDPAADEFLAQIHAAQQRAGWTSTQFS